MSGGPGTPAMSLDQVELAIDRLGADGERMAAALVDLENHPGRGFLDGAQLTGTTEARWTTAKATIGVLWEQFQQYRQVLDQAKEVRARRNRPSSTDLHELTALLRGPAVMLASENVPLQRRDLTGPATITHRMTLADLVTSMTEEYQQVSRVVVAVDLVWSAYAKRLDQLQSQVAGARSAAGSLGLGEAADPVTAELSRISDELATISELVFADPLALHVGELDSAAGGHADVSRLLRVEQDLTPVRAGLDDLVELRAGLDTRIGRLRGSLDELAGAVAEAGRARATVLDKIAVSTLPDVPDPTPELRRRLDPLTAARPRRNWSVLGAQLDALTEAIGAALAQARGFQDTAAALLGRRAELRGRLDAYQAKAGHLGHAEDIELGTLHQQAHDLLWTVPCDLQAATRALVRYQQAIADRGPKR
jgi:hypothetical protein